MPLTKVYKGFNMKIGLSKIKAKMNDYELEKYYHPENFWPDYKLQNDDPEVEQDGD